MDVSRLEQRRKALEIAIKKAYQQLARLQRERVEVEALVEKVKRLPDGDSFTDGDVIYFQKRFPDSSRWFRYVALRDEGRWYTSGPRSAGPYSWEDLTAWMANGGFRNLIRATEWEGPL